MNNINLVEARKFLACFTGEHTFQIFSEAKGASVISRHKNLRFEDLERENINGGGVFFMVNEGDGKGRRKENVVRVRAVFADFDNTPFPDSWVLTPSIIVQTSTDGHHAYWLLDDDMPLDKFTLVQKSIATVYGSDSSVHDLPRVMRVPGFLHQKREPFLTHLKECNPDLRYSSKELFSAHPPIVANISSNGSYESTHKWTAEGILTKSLQNGDPIQGRNRFGLEVACQMRDNGISQQECERVLLQSYQSQYENAGDHPYTQDEVRASVSQAYSRVPRDAWKSPSTNGHYTLPQNEATRGEFESDTCTDLGNRDRFVRQHRDKFRFNPKLGWLMWNNKYWKLDNTGQVKEAAILTVRSIYREAADCGDKELRKKLANHAKASESRLRVNNMVAFAETVPSMIIHTEELDLKPWLFNVANGTLNLKTRKLQDHNKEDYITKYSDVDFDPSVKHAAVDQLMDLLSGDNKEEFLKRSFGSCLWGEAPNEKLWYIVGDSGTGKSTLMEALRVLLGTYAVTADVSLIIKGSSNTSSSSPRPELLNLRGARLVIAKETPKNARLNAAEVKALTGRDAVSGRPLYSNDVLEFVPVFKLFVHSNFDIELDFDDAGAKRRLLRVPFNTKPDKVDPELKTILQMDRKSQSALLNLLFEGFVNWADSGYDLAIPETILESTEVFWKSIHPFDEFAEERLSFADPEAITPSGEIWQAYKEWCEYNARKPRYRNELWKWLTQRGCDDKRRTIELKTGENKQVRVRVGVSVV